MGKLTPPPYRSHPEIASTVLAQLEENVRKGLMREATPEDARSLKGVFNTLVVITRHPDGTIKKVRPVIDPRMLNRFLAAPANSLPKILEALRSTVVEEA